MEECLYTISSFFVEMVMNLPRKTYHESHAWMMIFDIEKGNQYTSDVWDINNTGHPLIRCCYMAF